MSKRLLQRGRYPRAPAVDQVTTSSSQFPQASLAQCPVTSEVPYYPPVQSQPTQNMWNQPLIPNPSTFQSNQAPHPVSEPNNYWSSSQMYSTQVQSNDPWNWKVENNVDSSYLNYQSEHQQSGSNHEHQLTESNCQPQQQQPRFDYQQTQLLDSNYQQHIDINYQQQQQLDTSYQQQQQLDIRYQQQQQQLDTNYQQQQCLDTSYQQQQKLDTSYHSQQDSNYHHQQQPIDPNYQQLHSQNPNYQQPASNYQQHSLSQTESWPQLQQAQIENKSYIHHPMAYITNSQQNCEPSVDSHLTNNNYNATNLDTSLQPWENGTLTITQPVDLPWTYSAPQYCNPTMNTSDFPSNPVSSNAPWNFNPVNTSELETCSKSDSNYLSNDNINGAVGAASNQNIENECEEDTDSSNVPDCDTASINRDLMVDAEFVSSSLSAFFQNTSQNSCNNSEYGGASTPDIKNVLDISSADENVAQLQINHSEKDLSPTKDKEDEQNLEDTDDVGNQEINYCKEEKTLIDENNKIDLVIGFVEEPVNQEVPEPSTIAKNSATQIKQDYHEMSPEEPLNQQVPTKSGDKSRSTSSERERVVIRPREESPFKPPRISSNSKGTIMQQEIPVQNTKETKHADDITVVQEVNLETFPDNLERPPDYEELQKQSSFYVSHQKHLRTELNSSPSSLLCDNPDIPCVTLAPAAPPIHSSVKSDKSESSSDSRREMASYDNTTPLKNSVKEFSSSPVHVDSELSEHSMSSGSYLHSTKDSNESKSNRTPNKSSPNASKFNTQPQMPNEQNNKQPPPYTYLKDSKIKDVRNPDIFRKPEFHAENLQNPNGRQSCSSGRDYYSQSNRYPNEAEYNRQRFADRKYPSFDERQYYSDRERSRPPSRSSLDDRPEDYRYAYRPRDYPLGEDRRYGHPDYGRPPSRLSESDVNRPDRHSHYDYYKQQYPYGGHYSRNPDYYQKPTSFRGYEYDPYQRDPYYSSYYDAYRYAYSNYNYGFYDELYGNDPRYRQYREEQYRQYYAKYGYEGDYDRSSAHSGRSSANEFTKDTTSNQYSEQDVSSNASEISAYNIRQDYSYDEVPNEVSISGADQSSTPSTRLTPVKFPYAHTIAKFSSNGILITTVPNQVDPTLPAPIKIQNMQNIMENEDSFQELKNYQGPLIRGLTHKNDVIEFCNQKIKFLRKKADVVDRDSYILLWDLMILLLRQNGAVAGSDIAELLLKDHEVLRTHATPLKHNIDTPLSEQSPAEVNDSSSQSHAGDTSSPDEGIVVLHDKSMLNTSKSVDMDKVTQKFREFLLFGHKKDALEWSMKHSLWGHALFLASKMDLRTYANVMTRFANSLALNDPLQTLYQLMSGRQPSAVTCVADKKWGDWRPHLAMILSNPSTLPDVDSRSITTLGDTLASRGCLPASHFCYIMAQIEFGTFEQKNSKLVLLSTDHRLLFEEFATNEGIQCTEIYEYAQSLANPGYLLIHLQMYKFLYALRLVEHGFLEEALHYCEVIAGNLQAHPTLFSYDLVAEVFKLSSQLKYYDPHFLRGQGEYEDQDDPDWLKSLDILVRNYYIILQGQNSQTQVEQPSDSTEIINDSKNQQPIVIDNTSYQSVPQPSMQTETSNTIINNNFYQPNNWNQQATTLPNVATTLSNNQQEMHSYYQHAVSNQNAFQFESSVPSHEENDTTDVPSSPITQTSPFDYYAGSTQQEWSPVHSLPSVSLSDAGTNYPFSKSDLENLVQKEETESDIVLCSSTHSTPLHNYLLSKDDSDDRQMLMTSNTEECRTLNSCLKSKHSINSKSKKCIKFDASVSGHQGRLQRSGIRRRKFSKKRNEIASQSDSSPEGSPSKEKHKSKLSLLASLGILRNDSGSSKLSKRKRKSKKKNETIEKLLQSKKTFAIDEPLDTDEMQKEKSTNETKKIIGILKKISDEEKKNSELSQLMANEFNKKPPLIFGGTYPIDEPFESKKSHFNKNLKVSNTEDILESKIKLDYGNKIKRSVQPFRQSKPNNCIDKLEKFKYSEKNMLTRMSPVKVFKKMHSSGRKILLSKENVPTSSKTSNDLQSNILKLDKSMNESAGSDNKLSSYDQFNSYTTTTTRRERRDSALSSGSRNSNSNLSVARKPSIKETTKPEPKKDTKPSSQAGKTWLGGIFSRLLPKAPNQMILPDDKNPTIVWDEVKKRWVNKNSNEEDEPNTSLAPPTDMELMGTKSSETPSVPASNSMPPITKSPVNKFQRPKTRGMRQNYVDILNNSGATTKSSIPPETLFPSPYEQCGTSNMFIPSQVQSGEDNSSELESTNTYKNSGLEAEEQSQAVSAPLMFDPAEFDSRRLSMTSQRHTIGRTGRRTYPT